MADPTESPLTRIGWHGDLPPPDDDAEDTRIARVIAQHRAGYELHDGPIVASGEMVVTEHAETWTWDEDHAVRLPFTSVQQVRDGKVARWWDYLDLATLTNAAPPWWLEHIAPGYK